MVAPHPLGPWNFTGVDLNPPRAVSSGGESPTSGPTIGSPVFMEGVEKRPPGAAPALGQHSREILIEIGYAAEEIDRLLGTGVVRQADERRPFAAEKGALK